MNLFKLTALSSLLLGSTLVGCAPGNDSSAVHEVEASPPAYRPLNRDYVPNFMASTSVGRVMTTPEGATLYTFDKDLISKSTCYADCAIQWPPLIAGRQSQPYGRMSLVSRDDGRWQWAYDGKPLYTYSEDETFGDVKGENIDGLWHVVR